MVLACLRFNPMQDFQSNSHDCAFSRRSSLPTGRSPRPRRRFPPTLARRDTVARRIKIDEARAGIATSRSNFSYGADLYRWSTPRQRDGWDGSARLTVSPTNRSSKSKSSTKSATENDGRSGRGCVKTLRCRYDKGRSHPRGALLFIAEASQMASRPARGKGSGRAPAPFP